MNPDLNFLWLHIAVGIVAGVFLLLIFFAFLSIEENKDKKATKTESEEK